MVTVELKPRRADIPITEENKKVVYVNAIAEYRISKHVKVQSDAFMSGFFELIS